MSVPSNSNREPSYYSAAAAAASPHIAHVPSTNETSLPPFPKFTIEEGDARLLKSRLKVIHQSLSEGLSKSWTTWLPFSSTKMNQAAEAHLSHQESDETQDTTNTTSANTTELENSSEEGQPTKPLSHKPASQSAAILLERVNQAQKLASNESQWVYHLDAAEIYLGEKQWTHAQICLESALTSIQSLGAIGGHGPDRIKTAQDAVFYLLGKIAAQDGNLVLAYKYFTSVLVSDKSKLVTPEESNYLVELAENKSKEIFNFLIAQLKAGSATDEEKSLIVRNVDRSDPDIVNILNKYSVDHSTESNWSIIARKVPSELLRADDEKELGHYFMKNGDPKLAEHHFEESVKKAPADKKTLYLETFYQATKSQKALKQLAEPGINKWTLLYAQSIKHSDPETAIHLAEQRQEQLAGDKADPKYIEVKEFCELCYWEKGASLNDAECHYQLAGCYLKGTHGVQVSIDTALSYLKRANAQKHPEATFILGTEYARRYRENKSYNSSYYKQLASEYFLEAEKLGHPLAVFHYSFLNKEQLVEEFINFQSYKSLKSYEMTYIRSEKIIEKYNNSILKKLLIFVEDKKQSDSVRGEAFFLLDEICKSLFIRQTIVKAIVKDYLIKACDLDFFPALIKLGKDLSPDLIQQVKFLRRAVDHVNFKQLAKSEKQNVLFLLANCYQKLNNSESKTFYQKAADEDYSPAMTILGDIYLTEKNSKEAKKWFEKATKAANPDASAFAKLATLA